jgi:hypothetical protein
VANVSIVKHWSESLKMHTRRCGRRFQVSTGDTKSTGRFDILPVLLDRAMQRMHRDSELRQHQHDTEQRHARGLHGRTGDGAMETKQGH